MYLFETSLRGGLLHEQCGQWTSMQAIAYSVMLIECPNGMEIRWPNVIDTEIPVSLRLATALMK